MPIKAITFDCAQTLVDVAWNPEVSLCQAAGTIGLTLPQDAAAKYSALYKMRLPQFLQINLTRSAAEGRRFYEKLSFEWLTEIGSDSSRAIELTSAAENLIFGPDSSVFRVYSETVEALRNLRAKNFILGVVSNWDYSLHRVLEMFDLSHFLTTAVASLEEGVEKPDPKLFEIAMARLGCRPEETFHIGDDPVDDIQGAANSGIRAALIDRTQAASFPNRISSLLQIPEAIACLG